MTQPKSTRSISCEPGVGWMGILVEEEQSQKRGENLGRKIAFGFLVYCIYIYIDIFLK